MKILYLRNNQGDMSYYNESLNSLKKIHKVFVYAPPLYNPDHTVEDILKYCPFKPDLICFGIEWATYNPYKVSKINVSKLDIPSVAFMNKEYLEIDTKLVWVKENNIKLIFTFLKPLYKWEEISGARVVHLPFGVNTEIFKDYKAKKKYDFGFTGLTFVDKDNLWKLHDPESLRIKIIEKIKRMRGIKSYFGKQKSENKYARLINQSKMWLCTSGPLHYVTTRNFEVMACKALLLCNKIPKHLDINPEWDKFYHNYENLFEDGKHCVMFKWDLSDFEDKFFYYKKHNKERLEIIDRAYKHVREHHTWDKRIEKFNEEIRKKFNIA